MTITDYRNFDILIARSGDQAGDRAGARYRAFVVDSPAGEASVEFDAPFAAGHYPGLAGVSTDRRSIGASGEEPVALASLTDLGGRLYANVFCAEIQTRLAESLAIAAQEGAGLRVRLRFEADAASLAGLPWETLYDPVRRQFLALGEESPVVRYLSLPRSRSTLLVEPPLRVLVVLASPSDLPEVNVEGEWQAIQGALAGLVADGKVVLERLASPTLDALQQRLLGDAVHILHFVGHGTFDSRVQLGGLAFENATREMQIVRGEDLGKLLHNHLSVRLAFLNACEGAIASDVSVFTGVAQALVKEGVPAALAMQAQISQSGAVDLARTFYSALAGGMGADAALTQARVALSAARSDEWAIPVLFSRSPDNRLFDIRAVLPTPDCPYPGMTPFNEAQQELFFGRDRESEDAVERLRQHPFLAVIGPSGSGKSSLIYAGIIPALRRSKRFGPGEWQVLTMRPSDSRTPDGRAAPLAALAQLLGCPPDALARQRFDRPALLFVDQFEEVFTLAGAGEAQAFLDALRAFMDGRPNLYVLLTARADFYPELMGCSLWPQISANRLELTPLGDDELWAAIVEPAGRVGVTVDEALAVRLIADASGERGALPLVQETLVLLWDKVARRELKLAAYKGMADGGRSGLQVAIDRRASTVYNNLPEAAQPIARRIFLRLVQFGEGRADTRRQQTAAELRAGGDDPALFGSTLGKLVESRLLTASGEANDPDRRVDIAHEALIAGWPRLQEWLAQRRTAEQTRRRLEAKAAEWVAAQKRGGLLDEYELQEAETWLATEDAEELGYSQDLADLTAASRAAIAAAAAEKEAQQQRELAQAQKLAEEQRRRAEEGEAGAKRLRQRLVLIATLGLIAILAAVMAVRFGINSQKSAAAAEAASTLAVNEKNHAESASTRAVEQQKLAERQALASAAQSAFFRGDTEQDLPLAFAAVAASPGDPPGEVRPIFYRAADAYARRVLQGHTGTVTSVAFSPDGKTALSGSADKTLRLWDVATGQALRTFEGYTGWVDSVAFSPDGKTALSGSDDTTLRLWDVATGQALRTFQGHTHSVYSVAFSPDGKTALSGSTDGTLRLWQIDTLADLIPWVRANRYVPELPCETRALYHIDPQCQ